MTKKKKPRLAHPPQNASLASDGSTQRASAHADARRAPLAERRSDRRLRRGAAAASRPCAAPLG